MASVLTVEMTKMVEKLNLKNLTPDIDITDMKLASPEINRPALQLSGVLCALSLQSGCRSSGSSSILYLQSRSDEEKEPDLSEVSSPAAFPV